MDNKYLYQKFLDILNNEVKYVEFDVFKEEEE